MNAFKITTAKLKESYRIIALMLIATFAGFNSFAQPANDEPCAAITLTPTTTCVYQVFTNENATASPNVPAPGCASYQGGDVWFQVVVPAGGTLIFDSQQGVITDGGMAIYRGDCTNLALIECDDDDSPNGLMSFIYATGLTPGTTIWVRFWEFGNNSNGTFGICVTLPPPPPANDNCLAAVTVPVNPDFTCAASVQGSTLGATASTAPAPSCVAAAGTDDDVWYSFTATATTHRIELLNITGTTTNMAMTLYGGDCANLVELQCSDPNAMTVSGLFVGEVYFVRVWTVVSTAGSGANFTICIGTPPPPPANDNCVGAISLTVNPDLNCAITTNGSTASATQSTETAPSCGAGGVNDDIWYSFVATNTSHVVVLSNVTGVVTDMAMAVYSGVCGSLTQVQCSDPNTLIATGLTVGQTYLVRVWTFTATVGSFANFTICVGTPPPPPANDECSAAVALTVNADLNCGVFTAGTTAFTTPSNAPAPTCSALGVNDDVWYSFVATSPFHTIQLLNVTGTVTDMAMALYSGSCGTPTQLQCADPNTMSVNGLVLGQTYLIRVWTATATQGSSADFNICVGTPPPPPANDDPCNAITLDVPENGSCNFQTFSNQSATGTNGAPAPGCAAYQGGDVWFKLTVPCTGSVIIDATTGGITDGGMAIYSGTCDNLTFIECDDDDSPNGLMPRITRTGLVPGSTLWIRFWEFGNDNQGTFGICAQVPPPAPPASTCPTAQPFCTSTTPFTVPNITGQPSGGGQGAFGCLFTTPNPTYYYLQIQNTGSISVTISQTSTTGNPLDVDFIVWGPYNSLAASCTGISATNIIDCSYSTAAVEVADIPNAVAGQFYLFLVTNFSDQPGSITYQQTGGTGSSNCNIVCTLNAGNSGPVCTGALLNLTASTVTDATYSWTGPNCFSSTAQNPTGITAPSTPGVYTYTVTATALNGIACTDTTIVTVSPKPAIGADSSALVCTGITVDLTSYYNTTGLTSSWTLNNNPVANPGAIEVGGNYQLIVANSTGCTDTAFVNVTVNTVTADASAVEILCTQTGRITVTNVVGIAPFEYNIDSNPGVFQTSNEFVVPAGTYIITTRDSLGCITTDQVVVTVEPPFTVDAGIGLSLVSGDQGPLVGSANQPVSSVLWTPSQGLSSTNTLTTIANPTATTVYTLSAANASGCTDTDDVTVTIIPYCVRVRNAFSPNGDGINDFWLVYDQFDCLKNVKVNVFNRYGSKVFETKDYKNNWGGTYNGKPIPDGTYYAVIEFTLISGRSITTKTDLTIIR